MGLKSTVGLGLAVLVGAFASASSPAAAETRIAIAPSFLRLEGAAGGNGRVEIGVANRGDKPFDLAVATAPPDLIVADRSAVDWITVEPERLHIEPGERGTVSVAISIPSGVRSGGRYAAITFTTVAPDASGNAASMAGMIVVPVWLAVRGDGKLTRVPVIDRVAPILESDGRIGFRAIVHNEGNVHVQVAATVVVADADGASFATLDLPSRGILPADRQTLASHGTLPMAATEPFSATVAFESPPDVDEPRFEPMVRSMTFVPEPVLLLAATVVCENLDRGPTITGAIEVAGDTGVVPAIQFEVRDAAGASMGAASTPAGSVAWPHETTPFSMDLAERLVSGGYTVATLVRYGAGRTLEHETSFQIGGDPARAVALCLTLTGDTLSSL